MNIAHISRKLWSALWLVTDFIASPIATVLGNGSGIVFILFLRSYDLKAYVILGNDKTTKLLLFRTGKNIGTAQ